MFNVLNKISKGFRTVGEVVYDRISDVTSGNLTLVEAFDDANSYSLTSVLDLSYGVQVRHAIEVIRVTKELEEKNYKGLSELLEKNFNNMKLGEEWSDMSMNGMLVNDSTYKKSNTYKLFVIYGLTKTYNELFTDDKKKYFAENCYSFLYSCSFNEHETTIKEMCSYMIKNYNESNPELNIEQILQFADSIYFKKIPNSCIEPSYYTRVFSLFFRENQETVNNTQGQVNNNEIIDYTKPALSTAVSQQLPREDSDSSSDDDNYNEITTHRSILTNRCENKNNNSSKVIKKGNYL